jgi:hypothetical protein
MAKLFDKKGKLVEIEASQVLKALETGDFGVPKGQQVPMVSPDGEVYAFSVDDAIGASKEGWTFESEEQRRKRELQEKYGATLGQEITAGVAGAGRGLTFGLSDVALTQSGLVDPETLSGLKEANPVASMAGEVIGTVAPLLVPGGQGTLLARMGAAPRAVARLGAATERAAARALVPIAERGALGRVAARGAEMAAGSAVEGALYGGGQYISETALGDLDATAENLIASVGMGAVIGGGMGLGLGAGFQGVKELAAGTARLTKKGAKSLVSMWERESGETALPGLADAYARTSGKITDRPDEVATLMTKEGRARATKSMEVRDEAAREAAKLEDTMQEAYDDVFRATTGKRKKAAFEEMAAAGDRPAAQNAAEGLLGQADGQDGGIIGHLDEIIRGVEGGEQEFKSWWKKLRIFAEKARKEIDNLSDSPKAIGQIHGVLDDFKREIGHANTKMARSINRGNASGAAYASLEAGEQLYKRLMEPLQDPAIWGERAAEAQRRYNQKWVAYLEDIKRRPEHRFSESWETTDWEQKTVARPDGFRSYIDDLGSTKNDMDEPWLMKQIETRQALMDEAEILYDLPEATQIKVANAHKAMKRFQELHADIKKTVGVQNQLKALEQASAATGFSAGLGLVGGAVLGGPLLAAAGAAAGAVLNPGRIVRQLATLDRLSIGLNEKIGMAVERYAEKFSNAASKTATKGKRFVAPLSIGALHEISFDHDRPPQTDKDKVKAFKTRLNELSSFVTQPQVAGSKLEKTVETISAVAPKLAQTIQMKTMEAAQYLLAKAPKSNAAPTLFGKDWEPSATEIASFERTVRAVDNPMSIIKDMENGNLSAEAVEAVKTLYPKIYNRMVDAVIDNIDKFRESLPYEQRLQLSILFGAPVDPTMEPSFVAGIQTAMAAVKPVEIQPQGKPSKSTFLKPEIYMTQAQRLAAKQGGLV